MFDSRQTDESIYFVTLLRERIQKNLYILDSKQLQAFFMPQNKIFVVPCYPPDPWLITQRGKI